MADMGELANRFTYHPPTQGQAERYVEIRKVAHEFALAVLERAPKSRERSLAFTKIEEAVFWANAAIARNEIGDVDHA